MKLLNIVLIIATILPCGIQAQQRLVDKVVAKVGSEFITFSDIEEEYQYSLTLEPTLTEDAKCGIIANAISQKLIIYQAILDSVEVSDDEVETQLNLRFEDVLRRMGGDDELERIPFKLKEVTEG